MQNDWKRRAIPPLAALTVFAALALLYLFGSFTTYQHTLGSVGVRVWPWPYLDTDTVLSGVRCLRDGVDVYAANPCDPEMRSYGYSPLWMLLAHFPVTEAWIPWIGTIFALLFIAALWLLPAARNRDSLLLILLGLISAATILAVERGNNDLVNFALVASMAALMSRSAGARLAGYGLGLVAGMLKFYPLLVMASALRERPARFFRIAAASVVIVGVAAAITWHDLSRALAIIPTGSPFYEMFGAPNLGQGLAIIFNLPASFAGGLRVVLTIGAIALGVRYGLRAGTLRAVAALTERERNFLLIGALMVIGCFMTSQNIAYRTINLLLVLPSLTALRVVDAPRMMKAMTWAAILLLWEELIYRWIVVFADLTGERTSKAIELSLAWLPRELGWWWIVTMLIACTAAIIRPMAMGQWALGAVKAD
ncbi:MAG: hypothetical protein ACKOPQ_03340 [Novosphingobium sp.]